MYMKIMHQFMVMLKSTRKSINAFCMHQLFTNILLWMKLNVKLFLWFICLVKWMIKLVTLYPLIGLNHFFRRPSPTSTTAKFFIWTPTTREVSWTFLSKPTCWCQNLRQFTLMLILFLWNNNMPWSLVLHNRGWHLSNNSREFIKGKVKDSIWVEEETQQPLKLILGQNVGYQSISNQITGH